MKTKNKKKPFEIVESKALPCMAKGCKNQVIAKDRQPLVLCEQCKRKLQGRQPEDQTLI